MELKRGGVWVVSELVLGLIHRAVSEQNQAIFGEKTDLCLRCNGAGKIGAEMAGVGLVMMIRMGNKRS